MSETVEKKDWCTSFPDTWVKWRFHILPWQVVDISEGCEKHDDEEDPRGGCDSTAFAEYLIENKIVGGLVIFVVSSIVCWVRYPKSQIERL